MPRLVAFLFNCPLADDIGWKHSFENRLMTVFRYLRTTCRDMS